MPTRKACGARIHFCSDWKPGDLPPEGYLDWHEWAEVQHRAGLRPVECGRCAKWNYPQELSKEIDTWQAKDRRGRAVTIESPVCSKCATKTPKENT